MKAKKKQLAFWGFIILYNYTKLCLQHLKKELVTHILFDRKKSLSREYLEASAVDGFSAVESLEGYDLLLIKRRFRMLFAIE